MGIKPNPKINNNRILVELYPTQRDYLVDHCIKNNCTMASVVRRAVTLEIKRIENGNSKKVA